MGLGKTIQTIALLAKVWEDEVRAPLMARHAQRDTKDRVMGGLCGLDLHRRALFAGR